MSGGARRGRRRPAPPSAPRQTRPDSRAAPAGASRAAARAPARAGAAPRGPAARKMVEENQLDASKIAGTGKDGRVTKGDVTQALGRPAAPAPAPAPAPSAPAAPRVGD